MGKVRWEKEVVVLKPNTTQELAIISKAAATISLTLAQVLPGIEVTIDKANLNSGEKATVTLKAGENPHTGVISFRVNPTDEIIAIQVKRQ
jgi:hypothetical protein